MNNKNNNFYSFFGPLMPSINRLQNGVQVISGSTAAVGIWYVIAPYVEPFHWLTQSVIAVVIIALAIAVIEGGLRKISPYAIRQTVWWNFDSKWWVIMYVPICVIAMMLMTSTTTLSWFASPEIVESVKPNADTISLNQITGQYDSRRSEISNQFKTQKDALMTSYQAQADQIKSKHNSKRASYKKRAKKADNEKDRKYLLYMADRENQRKKTSLASLAELQRTELSQITSKENDALALIDLERSAIVGDAIESNQSAMDKVASSVSIWSRFLAFISAGSTFLFVFLQIIKEVYKRGSADTPPNHIPSDAVVVPVSNQTNYAAQRHKETTETAQGTKDKQYTFHSKRCRLYWKRYTDQPKTETGKRNKQKSIEHADALEQLGYAVTVDGSKVNIKPIKS